MTYHIAKINGQAPTIDSEIWEKAETGVIACQPWEGYSPAPRTTFQLIRYDGGFCIRMHTDEIHLRAEETKENGSVCEDSCMEFFFKPDPHDGNYINFEVNPRGVMHVGLGKDRYGRQLIDEPRTTFRVETRAEEGDWTLKYEIPDAFLLRYFGKLNPVFRGNFYKCGDLTDHPHYATWAPVYTEKPDYHVSDFFGMLKMEE